MSCIEVLLQLPETSESELSKLRPLPAPLALPDKAMLLSYQKRHTRPCPNAVPFMPTAGSSCNTLLPSASGLLHRPFPQSIGLSLTLKNKFSLGLPKPFQCPQGIPHTHTPSLWCFITVTGLVNGALLPSITSCLSPTSTRI